MRDPNDHAGNALSSLIGPDPQKRVARVDGRSQRCVFDA